MKRFAPELLRAVRSACPADFLRRRFPTVLLERGGTSISVPKVLRADLKGDRWVACDWNGSAIGDNIALMMAIDRVGFVDAVRNLSSSAGSDAAATRTALGHPSRTSRTLVLPPTVQPDRGRRYLAGRGISGARIAAAESTGALRYFRSGLLFLGFRGATAASPLGSATVRYYEPVRQADGSTITKRDLAGSDKRYPMVSRGDPRLVAIVEGAINALAVQDLAEMEGSAVPTVVTTGGVHVRRWLRENVYLREVVAAASSVTLWSENERGPDGQPDAAKQAQTDAARNALERDLGGVARNGGLCRRQPPDAFKDVGEWIQELRRHSRPGTLPFDPAKRE